MRSNDRDFSISFIERDEKYFVSIRQYANSATLTSVNQSFIMAFIQASGRGLSLMGEKWGENQMRRGAVPAPKKKKNNGRTRTQRGASVVVALPTVK